MTSSYLNSFLNPNLPRSGDNVAWSHMFGTALGMAVVEAALRHHGILVIVLEDQRQLQILESEIRYFSENSPIPILNFPSWECLPYDVFSPHQDIISERLQVLSKLHKLDKGIILTQTSNLMQKLPPVDYVLAHSFSLEKNQKLDLDNLKLQLISANYLSVHQVISPGEFAVRGGLVDIYPMGSQFPFRLDLFDDELESIRVFDPETQRSTDHVDSIELLPAREFPMTEAGIMQFRSSFRRQFEGDPRKQTVYNEVSQGNTPPGTEFFFPLFFQQTATFFDYLKKDALFINTPEYGDALMIYWAEIKDRYSNANYDSTRKVLPPDQVFLEPDEFRQHQNQFCTIIAAREVVKHTIWSAPCALNKQFPVDPRNEAPYFELLKHLKSTENKILLVAETPGRREALEGMLMSNQIRPVLVDSFTAFLELKPQLALTTGMLERGFNSTELGIEIISESQLYGEKVYQRRRRSSESRDPESIIKSLAELNIGDPVVHIEHGVGRYKGLQSLDIVDEESEFLMLEYQDGDKLYVPVVSLNLISRFVGGSPELAPLHRLGGEQWDRSKKRARQKAYDVATELLEVQAFRNARKGTSFELGENELERFTSQFPFEETPDQLQVINEVIADLQSDEPMDRLVCGDVGFGKTEVALRAAFVVGTAGKQVALLSPTTLLAQQHYQTFIERFTDWPVNIVMLSRFNTKKRNALLLEQVKTGNADIVIGTHKLLQDDVVFKDLGLLMIDEEHRFGVRQKEKIKRLRSQVDILTLTATPIPRTLNITMAGLRSISIIATPPVNRLSIKTFVREWNRGLIREACLREIRRGGQVFFLHNEVKSIERMAQELTEIVPEAQIDIGHGQMRELQLERVMQDFYHQRFNILVCSTIVESGIDIPSANTIIINRADKFGMAQLHQLRGRVGRSHHQAFAYLLTPDQSELSTDAKKRLDAIDSMEDLGAGFALASHDLEIRGAGELLGETQSGSIDDVGFSLYSEYLSQAVKAIKEGRLSAPKIILDSEKSTHVDLHVPALFPNDYLANAHSRLILYKRISSATNLEQLQELQIETIDRFGLLPEQAKNLFRITAIHQQAEKLDIKKLEMGDNGGLIEFHDDPIVDPIAIFNLIQEDHNKYRFFGPNAFKVFDDWHDSEYRLDQTDQLLQTLAGGIIEPDRLLEIKY